MRQPEQRGCKYWQSTTTIPLHQGILRQTARYCGLSFQNFVPSDFGMSMFCNKSRKKTQENRSFPGKRITFLSLAELRCATGGFEAVFLKVLGSKILYLSRFLRVMPLGCPLGCPREAPVLVWCLFPLSFYNIAQADCFFKRQEEEPILFGSSTGYSAFAYMLLNALFTMVDSASGLLYFTLAYMSIVILLFS